MIRDCLRNAYTGSSWPIRASRAAEHHSIHYTHSFAFSLIWPHLVGPFAILFSFTRCSHFRCLSVLFQTHKALHILWFSEIRHLVENFSAGSTSNVYHSFIIDAINQWACRISVRVAAFYGVGIEKGPRAQPHVLENFRKFAHIFVIFAKSHYFCLFSKWDKSSAWKYSLFWRKIMRFCFRKIVKLWLKFQ